jgi:DNA-directed RNA polymerase specialized sigma24 family protein
MPDHLIAIARRAARRWGRRLSTMIQVGRRRVRSYDDAEMAAYEGCIRALETHNPQHGVPLEAWAALQARWAVQHECARQARHQGLVSLDDHAGCDAGETLVDALPAAPGASPDAAIELEQLVALAGLSDDERAVLALTRGLGGHRAHSLADAAAGLNVSVVRARTLRDEGLRKLRRVAKALTQRAS